MFEVLREQMSERSARGLADAFSRGVRDGQLRPGQRLPSIRSTAKALDLSPTTVSAAWRLLQRANLIHADGARGTIVANGAGQGPLRYGRAIQYQAVFSINLSSGLPDAALLPPLGPSLRRIGEVQQPESFLASPIVPELERHLMADWPIQPERLTMVDGATDALDLIIMSYLQFGDRVAVENPTYPPLLDLLDAMGARTVALDVDESGPTPTSVSVATKSGVRALFLQPRAHNPTGVSLTRERAVELTQILESRDTMVIEFDLYGPVSTSPLVSLSSTLPSRVIHVRGFSASHGPDLRLAAIGGGAELMDPLIRRRHLGQGWSSRLLQRVLLDLLTDDESRAVVDQARSTYGVRRRHLRDALKRNGLRVLGGDDGLTFWIPVENESVALMILASRGIGVAPGSPYVVSNDGADHIAVTIGQLTDEQIEEVASAVASAARPTTFSPIH